ncbi:MAG: type IV secretion system protein [Alphaproteobacteria bacterium]|nr:type IV secretion system protein [Alphaproteobacteria bacterium]
MPAPVVTNRNNNQRLLTGKSIKPDSGAGNEAFVANVAEKRYLWTARAFAIITAVSFCCNLILLLAILQVIPLYRVEPFLMTFQNKEEQVYNIQPVNRNLTEERAITEAFVRQYVLMRSSFNRDIPEVEARWGAGGAIQEMSSSAVYDDFIKNTAGRALELIRTRRMMRDVRIMTVNELSDGVWQVEYETRDMYPDSKTPEINYWTASLKVMYRYKSVKFKERLKNPVGFTVVNYSLSYNKVK